MSETIKIYSKKAFRFPNPNAKILKAPGKDPAKKSFDVAYFDTKPLEIQEAPAWIKQDEMFEWACKDGDIVEVVTSASTAIAQEAAAKQAQDGSTKPEEKQFGGDEDKLVELQTLTKSQLVDHALEEHDLELDPKLKKEELISAIEEARKKGGDSPVA